MLQLPTQFSHFPIRKIRKRRDSFVRGLVSQTLRGADFRGSSEEWWESPVVYLDSTGNSLEIDDTLICHNCNFCGNKTCCQVLFIKTSHLKGKINRKVQTLKQLHTGGGGMEKESQDGLHTFQTQEESSSFMWLSNSFLSGVPLGKRETVKDGSCFEGHKLSWCGVIYYSYFCCGFCFFLFVSYQCNFEKN